MQSIPSEPPSALLVYLQEATATISHNPWGTLLHICLTICIITRAFTQVRSNLRAADFKSSTKLIPRPPYWIPYLANIPLFAFRSQSSLLELSRRYQSNVFGLTLSGRDYIVVTSPALQTLLANPSTPVSTKDFEDQETSRFFGHRHVSSKTSNRFSKALESFTTDSSRHRKLTRLLEVHAYNFISPSKSWVDQAQWERGADTKVLASSPSLSISASLALLTRDFSAYVVLSSVLGTSFMEANANFVGDFFAFSSKHKTFMTGLPYWIAPGLGPPALSRERCLLALDSLVAAIQAELDGKSMSGTGAGMLYDLDDVHAAVWEIIRETRTEAKDCRPSVRDISCEVLGLVWNVTFISVNVVTWTLIYLFGKNGEHRSVVEDIRSEIQKVIQITKQDTGLPIEEPPRLSFTATNEQSRIEKTCPILHGALLEVLRLETEPEEYLTVQEDFILSADAAPDPHSTKKPALLSNIVERFQLKKGDRIYAAYGATNKDAYYWDRPRRFAPNRYGLSVEKAAKSIQLPKMRSARRIDFVPEAMYIVIALISLHDFDVPDHPGTNIIAGVGVPKGNVRATISRRKF